MSFISYAQNFEDVMLWRALKHVEQGFYVDIGAQDPLVDSVSLAFYEHGWRGVHVEPTQQYSDKLRMARPDETVLQVAIGNQAGTLSFYEFEDTGLSTADIDIAHRHQEAGFHCIETMVSVISLDKLFERIGVRDIHWLKLDVEGLEKAVLESWKNCSILPWVLVVESTRPMTQEESHGEWEQLLLVKGYRYVYFDGLNRFYVSPNHLDLAKAFSSPPNIFDGFVLSGSASQPFYKLVESQAQQAETKAQQAETKAQQAETKAQQAETKAQQAETKAQQAEAASNERLAQLQAVYASSSWKITRPLRGIKRLLSGDFAVFGQSTAAVKLKAKQTFRPAVVAGIDYVNTRPALRNRLKRLVGYFPWLRQRLVRVALNSRGNFEMILARQRAIPLELQNMTPRARQIYQDLKMAIEKKNKGAA
jgi:FkbM family methyltransferase